MSFRIECPLGNQPPSDSGYKEFSRLVTSNKDISDGAWLSAAEAMKHNTRKYAQRQVKWIRNKLLPTIKACNALLCPAVKDPASVQAYLLDATGAYNGWHIANLMNFVH